MLLFLSRIRSNDYSWEFSALRGSGIALYSEQATPKSTPNMYAHACTYKYTRHKIYISWGHQLLQCLGIKIEFTRFRKAKNKALRTPFRHKGKVARFDAYIQNVLKAATGVFFKQVGFPRGDTSHPLNPDVGLSAANIQQFFELTKRNCKNVNFFRG